MKGLVFLWKHLLLAMVADISNLQVAVVGGGSVGSTLANAIAESKMTKGVVVAARDPAKTMGQLAEKNLSHLAVMEQKEAIAAADVVLLATPGMANEEDYPKFVESLGVDGIAGKVVIDASNPLGPFPEGLNSIVWGSKTSGGELMAKYLPPSCKVYKSINTLGVEHMKAALGKDMMIAGDETAESRAIAEAVVAAVGFKPFFVGPIRYARNLEAFAELWIHMAVPPLGARNTSRKFWFSISGDP